MRPGGGEVVLRRWVTAAAAATVRRRRTPCFAAPRSYCAATMRGGIGWAASDDDERTWRWGAVRYGTVFRRRGGCRRAAGDRVPNGRTRVLGTGWFDGKKLNNNNNWSSSAVAVGSFVRRRNSMRTACQLPQCCHVSGDPLTRTIIVVHASLS